MTGIVKVKPLCSYFGECGGCTYQDLAYEDELWIKESELKKLFCEELEVSNEIFLPIVPSPEPYFYRSRLDLSLRRVQGQLRLGFTRKGTRRHVPIESCSIARPEINAFMPLLEKAALEKIPHKYRSANLVVKTDNEGKIHWGGIGRRSLKLSESDYFWTEIEGKRIFYSLDSFFQANLAILPKVAQSIRSLLNLDKETHLLDLYAGVGLFWAAFAEEVKSAWAIEESKDSCEIAEFNKCYHKFDHVHLIFGKTEDFLSEVLSSLGNDRKVAIVDPPRKGLSPTALQRLKIAKELNRLVYISCQPQSLLRDLKEFRSSGWEIDQIIPFDFFPRTDHLEVAARLHPNH